MAAASSVFPSARCWSAMSSSRTASSMRRALSSSWSATFSPWMAVSLELPSASSAFTRPSSSVARAVWASAAARASLPRAASARPLLRKPSANSRFSSADRASPLAASCAAEASRSAAIVSQDFAPSSSWSAWAAALAASARAAAASRTALSLATPCSTDRDSKVVWFARCRASAWARTRVAWSWRASASPIEGSGVHGLVGAAVGVLSVERPAVLRVAQRGDGGLPGHRVGRCEGVVADGDVGVGGTNGEPVLGGGGVGISRWGGLGWLGVPVGGGVGDRIGTEDVAAVVGPRWGPSGRACPTSSTTRPA